MNKINKLNINQAYILCLFSLLVFIMLNKHDTHYKLLPDTIEYKYHNKIVQIEETGEFPVTYFVNNYNDDEISKRLGIPKDELVHGMKYFKSNVDTVYNSEPINAAQKLNLKIPININLASESDLVSLPGIGIKTARKIIMYRRLNGNFTEVSELKNVYGIGINKFSVIKDLICVN